jgi:hypothetical protein
MAKNESLTLRSTEATNSLTAKYRVIFDDDAEGIVTTNPYIEPEVIDKRKVA